MRRAMLAVAVPNGLLNDAKRRLARLATESERTRPRGQAVAARPQLRAPHLAQVDAVPTRSVVVHEAADRRAAALRMLLGAPAHGERGGGRHVVGVRDRGARRHPERRRPDAEPVEPRGRQLERADVAAWSERAQEAALVLLQDLS